ncbi:hypothetical protein fugu_007775 [Takifugu bimaculatus]|uniref:Bloodthirsty-related gene family, member 1 n=1 Tax=Takifugu bimaculatus TaxID=433685 RepID=A0A4Z2AZJ7_9TELE|nr:hypothetical protein fugu_007775 [Takifugu bimaculatus]
MALAGAFLCEDQFTCSICLEVFENPVSTPCGHSFCQRCISSYWDGGRGGNRVYFCPICKESFRKRPELHINRTLKEITEQFKHIASAGSPEEGGDGGGLGRGSGKDPVSQSHLTLTQRPGEMPESVIAEMMTRFQRMPPPAGPHAPGSVQHPESPVADPPPYHTPPPRRYTLSGPSSSSPPLPLCPIHQRGLEFFCRTDNICICSTCVDKADHRGHNITPAKREWQIRKSQLGISETELRDLLSEREKKVEEIQESLEEIQAVAESQTDGAVGVFSKFISSVERCQADVLEVIELSRRAAEHRAQSLLKELEEEISELKNRSAALSLLTRSEDYVHFLKTFPGLSTHPPTKDWTGACVESELTSGAALRTVGQVMEQMQEEMQKLPESCQRILSDKSAPRTNPKTRRVQEYAADITLDPYTAHPRLLISPDGKQVFCGERHQQIPDNPERFDRVVCVLAHQGFSSGRHYWEVDVGGKSDWDLGVASRSVNRKGKITVSPAHGYWFLSLRDQTEYAFRTEPSTSLTVSIRPSRVGIYVDFEKGVVSFYNVEARLLIYTFTDTFPDTIYPFFSPCTNKSGRNEAPLIIRPVANTE